MNTIDNFTISVIKFHLPVLLQRDNLAVLWISPLRKQGGPSALPSPFFFKLGRVGDWGPVHNDCVNFCTSKILRNLMMGESFQAFCVS